MFSRLMCYSFTDWLTRQTVSDPAVAVLPSEPALAGTSELVVPSAFYPFSGAFPIAAADGGFDAGTFDAPSGPESAPSGSPLTSVDSAGWTEVVIQERSPYLSNVIIIGRKAEVNASINAELKTSSPQGFYLREDGGFPSDTSTCGCPGPSVSNNSSFSCLSFNEVTK